MQQFLDQLPRVIATKADPLRRRIGGAERQIIARALEATLHSRQATLVYHSKSSDRTKTYLIHPYRLAYAQGGMYVLAYVPEYQEIRTFALERIQEVSLLEERFTPIEELPDAAFPHSLGVHSGPPERVEIEFTASVADYVRSREWHESQTTRDLDDGGVVITLQVCRDRALDSWILGFGAAARVLFPPALVADIARAFLERPNDVYKKSGLVPLDRNASESRDGIRVIASSTPPDRARRRLSAWTPARGRRPLGRAPRIDLPDVSPSTADGALGRLALHAHEIRGVPFEEDGSVDQHRVLPARLDVHLHRSNASGAPGAPGSPAATAKLVVLRKRQRRSAASRPSSRLSAPPEAPAAGRGSGSCPTPPGMLSGR